MAAVSATFAGLSAPRRREVVKSLGELNKALATLKGPTIETVSAAARTPGAYALTVKTNGCQVVIRFEQAGVRVESLELDLGG